MSVRRYIANLVCPLIPPTRAYRLKALIWRMAGVQADASCRIVSSVGIHSSGIVQIGARSFVGHQTLIAGGDARVEIQDDVDIGPRVSLISGTHLEDSPTRAAGTGISLPIKVCRGAWLGAGSIILGGVTVGEHAVVAAGAVVARNVPPGARVAGVPAKPLES